MTSSYSVIAVRFITSFHSTSKMCIRDRYRKMEKKLIPDNLNYDEVPSLRLEARQKLKAFRPISVGPASRISGVSPADISVLLVYLEHYNIKNHS